MAAVHPNDQVIVVGGGLAGMSAANTFMEHGGKVVLLDKSAFCGGNSTKATSGINGAETKTQAQQGIKDTVEVFQSDCLKGGAKKPELIKVLCENSGPDIDWLQDAFNLDLTLLARLGGHSFPRTHRGKERFPGMTITYALIQMVEKIAERSDNARIVTKAEVTSLLTNGEAVVGVEYKKGGLTYKEFGSVILATGGFGADFQQDSLLAKYRPDLMHLPTTNGEHCTGDGIKISEAIGAKTIDLEWVQVHPTGLVNPKDQDAKVKFLAAEALRGVGGLVLDADGKRFANELGRRDYVTGEMWKNKGPFRLVLNKAASDEIIWHCKHYTGRGVMKYYESGKAFAQDINVPLKTLEAVHQAHYEAAKKQEADPEGGPFKAYPSGNSWDEPSGNTGSGKKFFHNIIPGSQVANEPFYVAIITPVIHYCMGGLEITEKSEVVSKKTGRPIPGLYAAGEVMGGVHGNNRLGGNSLLDCVVFGRVSGRAAAEYQLGSRVKKMTLKDLSGGGLTGEVTSSKMAGGSYEDNMNKGDVVKGAPAAGVAAPAAGGGGGGFTLEEVAKHTTNKDCWVVVNGDVLNVTNFLPDHPGGELAIMTFAGKDASEEFNMIHPPDVIPKYAPDAIIGRLAAAGAAGGAAAGGTTAAMEGGGLTAPLLAKGDAIPNDHYWGEWREIAKDENPGVLIINPGAWVRSVCSMVVAFVLEILKTIFTVKNFKFTNDRTGLTRSAVFIVFFMVIHAVGNLHIFGGPDDFNGYGYFYVRLYWSGFGLEANIVEEYVALCAVLHVLVALRRVYDVSGNMNLLKNKATLAVTGVFLLAFMCIHLVQFRFGATEDFLVRPPPYLINFGELLRLRLFWTEDENVTPVAVRDIYKLEFDLFQSPYWIAYYMFNILMFLLHGHFGWQQLAKLPAFGIPKGHIGRVQNLGTCIFVFVAACYFSFPLYCHFTDMKPGVIPQRGGVALSPHHGIGTTDFNSGL